MNIIIVGGPKRGKTSLARYLVQVHGLEHYCTDPQRLCVPGAIGTPDDMPYGDVSQWVANNWIGQPGRIIEGVRAASALDRKMAGSLAVPADRIIYLRQTLAPAGKSGQLAQATKTAIHMHALWDRIVHILEEWEPISGSLNAWRKIDRPQRV